MPCSDLNRPKASDLRPAPGYVLTRRIKDNVTAGGIELPDDVRKGSPWLQEVLAVGATLPGAPNLNLNPGDRIFAPPFCDYEIRLTDETVLAVRHTSIIAGVVA